MGITIAVYGIDHPHAAGHLRDLDLVDGVDRLLVHDPDELRAHEAVKGLTRGEYLAAWDSALDRDDIEAVCILADSRDAGQLTLQAMEHGKWVYGDKPGAADVATMEAIVRIGERRGVWFCPSYARRTYAETRRLTEIVQGGMIGEVRSFQATWITSTAGLRGTESWLFDGSQAGGGIMVWLACHWLDYLHIITNSRVVAVSAMTTTTDARISVEDIACVSLRLESGAIGTLRAGYLLDPFPGYEHHDLTLQFEGSRGSVALFPTPRPELRLRRRDADGLPLTETIDLGAHPDRGGYGLDFLQLFVDALAAGGTPPATQHDALYVMRVCQAVYDSAASGREQTVG